MTTYYDSALRWWDGAQWRPDPADWAYPAVTSIDPTAIVTSVTLAVSATTINNGQSVTLTATVTGAASGSVEFYAGATRIATDTGSPWTATHSPTSTTTYTAKYVANGAYLGSSSTGKTVTVRQKVTKTCTQGTRSSWAWGQSSAPHSLQSTFGVNGGTNNIPHSSATITAIKLQVASYYGSPTGRDITAGIYSSAGTALATKTVTLATAGSSDAPLSASIDLADVAVSTGTYRIGFGFTNTNAIQWDIRTGASGYTLYEDGAAVASQSLLWEITYYIWQ